MLALFLAWPSSVSPSDEDAGGAAAAGGSGPSRFGRRDDAGSVKAATRRGVWLFERRSRSPGAPRARLADGGVVDDPVGEYNLPGEAVPPAEEHKARRRRRRTQGRRLTKKDVLKMPVAQREQMQAEAYRGFAMSLVDMLGSPGVHHGNNPSDGMADMATTRWG